MADAVELGLIGLGRMGANMAQRLTAAGHRVVTYDLDAAAVAASRDYGAEAAAGLPQLCAQLSPPRAVWLMLPQGQPTQDTIDALASLLSPGDTLVDGGNAYYKDSIRRARALQPAGVSYLDVGISGGIWGLAEGYCLMVGGDAAAAGRLAPVFHSLSPGEGRGYSYVGGSGAGHFVKMVHNAVEYALMEAYAEGFELLAAKEEFDFDLPAIAETWRHGSVVRSWLLDLAAAALQADPQLAGLDSYVEDTGEGRWAVQESVELAVPAPAMALALQQRFRSRQEAPLAGKLLAALRREFGGHSVNRPPPANS